MTSQAPDKHVPPGTVMTCIDRLVDANVALHARPHDRETKRAAKDRAVIQTSGVFMLLAVLPYAADEYQSQSASWNLVATDQGVFWADWAHNMFPEWVNREDCKTT